jgi:hypothetical protein
MLNSCSTATETYLYNCKTKFMSNSNWKQQRKTYLHNCNIKFKQKLKLVYNQDWCLCLPPPPPHVFNLLVCLSPYLFWGERLIWWLNHPITSYDSSLNVHSWFPLQFLECSFLIPPSVPGMFILDSPSWNVHSWFPLQFLVCSFLIPPHGMFILDSPSWNVHSWFPLQFSLTFMYKK